MAGHRPRPCRAASRANAELELDPAPGRPGSSSSPGPASETAAQLSGRFYFDLPSTAQLDLSASWQEVQDDPSIAYASEDEMVRPARGTSSPSRCPSRSAPRGSPRSPRSSNRSTSEVVGFRTRGRETETPESERLQPAQGGRGWPRRRRSGADWRPVRRSWRSCGRTSSATPGTAGSPTSRRRPPASASTSTRRCRWRTALSRRAAGGRRARQRSAGETRCAAGAADHDSRPVTDAARRHHQHPPRGGTAGLAGPAVVVLRCR